MALNAFVLVNGKCKTKFCDEPLKIMRIHYMLQAQAAGIWEVDVNRFWPV